MESDVLVKHRIVREKLFERTLPEARWSCKRYAPAIPRPKRNWRLKESRETARLSA